MKTYLSIFLFFPSNMVRLAFGAGKTFSAIGWVDFEPPLLTFLPGRSGPLVAPAEISFSLCRFLWK